MALGTRRAAAVAARRGATAGCAPAALDVGLAGTILVVGARVDAEALTRARAMGVRGVVVGGLAGKERRDFLASEARQRAALHRLPPFAVLILDGVIRRPIAGPVAAILAALAGREVAIVGRPAGARLRCPDLDVPPPPADHVRVRAGDAGPAQEGRWAGLAGIAPVRGRRPPRGRPRCASATSRAGRGPAGRPRAVRLTMAGRLAGAAAADPRRRPPRVRVTTPTPPRRRPRRAARPPWRVPGDLLCLWGELGAGKTQLAKGFGAASGSPTRSTRRASC